MNVLSDIHSMSSRAYRDVAWSNGVGYVDLSESEGEAETTVLPSMPINEKMKRSRSSSSNNDDSAERPVKCVKRASEPDALQENPVSDVQVGTRLDAHTPLFDKLVEKLNMCPNGHHGHDFVRFLERKCFWDDPEAKHPKWNRWKDLRGVVMQTPISANRI